jgi:adenine-specific DNA-methyltransferase
MSNSLLKTIGDKPWNLETEDGGQDHQILDKLKLVSSTLSTSFDIHSGIETGADRVTPKHLDPKASDGLDRSLKAYKAALTKNAVKNGDGVFVLDYAELEKLNLSKDERSKYVMPLIKNGDIKPLFRYDRKNCNQFLIYFPNGSLNAGSKIYKHLKKFKPILENRYKYKTEGRLEWFDLHRPLNEKLISAPKIVSPYRAVWPRFSFSQEPTYALLDVFFTTPLNANSNLNLALGLLNSRVIWYWLRQEGKKKGKIVELTAKPLRTIPFENFHFTDAELKKVTKRDLEEALEVTNISRKRAALLISALVNFAIEKRSDIDSFRDKIDNLAASYFGLSAKDLIKIKRDLSEFEVQSESIDSEEAA